MLLDEKIKKLSSQTRKGEAINISPFPTNDKVNNLCLEVKHNIWIYTKTQKSKCFYASGYYLLNKDSKWTIAFCPKYILLKRHEFIGPFKTEDECKVKLKSLNVTFT